MRFELQAKYGRHWRPMQTIEAIDSLMACHLAQRQTGRNWWRVRPDGSRDKFLVYRLKPRTP